MSLSLPVLDLGRLPYAAAFDQQRLHHARILESRTSGSPIPGILLLVEHDPPVITITRRPGARDHLIATNAQLAAAGVTLAETDRGGDITYHGPGQLVAYPILDLNFFRLRLHDYMRLLEASIIDTCAAFGVPAERDHCATGVWVPSPRPPGSMGFQPIPSTSSPAAITTTCPAHDSSAPQPEGRNSPSPRRKPWEVVSTSSEPSKRAPQPLCAEDSQNQTTISSAKICAMGVRISRWISLHGLALNVTTNLDHFQLIVPCGLAGRPVTSLTNELGERCPSMSEVKQRVHTALATRLAQQLATLPAESSL